jgi:hypothetical protein
MHHDRDGKHLSLRVFLRRCQGNRIARIARGRVGVASDANLATHTLFEGAFPDAWLGHGIAPDRASLFEDHDLVPVYPGGDNASPLNHWPQALRGEWGAERPFVRAMDDVLPTGA